MKFLRFFNVVKAWRDLREFLGLRSEHEWLFAAGAASLTGIIIAGFVADSAFDIEYHPEITWVKSWSENPTKEELAERKKLYEEAKAEVDKARAKAEERRRQFQELDNKMEELGI